MSEDTREVVDLPGMGDAAFSTLMDALAPEEGTEAVGDGATAPAGTEAAATNATDGGTDSTGTGAAKDGQPATAAVAEEPPASDDAGGDAAGSAERPDAPGGATDLPADWTADASDFLPKLGKLSSALEETVIKRYQQESFDQAREDYEKYFEALETHPRLLVGTQVPAIGKEGMETLRDSNDAKEWQEAVRSLLVQEVEEATQQKLEESGSQLQTLHASIDLFKNNKDLIPGTKNFNKTLADEFAKLAMPYEVRQDGKLQGYSIPVQPIIDALRQKQTDPPPSAKQPEPKPATTPPGEGRDSVAEPDPPQAGIPSKAGSSAEKEDFSTLFGTIGLPHLQI